MPVVRIAMLKGKSEAHIRGVADSVHAALTESYDVHEGDRFQMIDLYEAGHFVFDRHFAAGPRSDDFVLISITAGARTSAVKEAFMKCVTERLAQAPGVRPQDVMIVIGAAITMEDLSFGDGISAATLQARLKVEASEDGLSAAGLTEACSHEPNAPL